MPPPARARRAPGRRGLWWLTLLLAGGLCLITFYAKGGLTLESMTATEMALTLAAGLMVAAAVVMARSEQRSYGLWSAGLLIAFTLLTAASVIWSVQPGASWRDSGRMLAYTAVFAAVLAFVRLAPERWPAVLGGVTLAAVVVSLYALLTKVFPPTLTPAARLGEPYGYWNAVGLTAAMGAIGCMWLGARRTGHALLSTLAYPGMGVLLLTLALAYSRGALVALAAGLVLWFFIVPLRLRGAAVLITGGLAAAAVAAWDFSRHALSAEGVPLAERASEGHRLGALLLAMVLLLTLAGVSVGFLTSRRAPSAISRTRAGVLLLGLILAALIAFAGALAHSHRGLTGSISHTVDALTNPNAKPPPNTPGRLTAVASVRARYWKEGLEVFDAHPLLGAGAMGYQTARLRYRQVPLTVAHAHGFIIQTLADLGLVGLALALALLATWMAAAGRATHPFNRSWATWGSWRHLRSRGGTPPGWRRTALPYTPERIALLSMLCLVVVFGVHSLVDWTWYFPGDACVALICGAWLAGRGPLAPTTAAPGGAAGAVTVAQPPAPGGMRPRPRSLPEIGHLRLGLAAVAVAAALLAAWSQWQPQRAEDAREQALELLAAHHPQAALARARLAVARDPLSPLALISLAEVQQDTGSPTLARGTLQRAVREQPSNPQTWLALGRHDVAGNPGAAVTELQAAIYLDPQSIAPELLSRTPPDPEAVSIYNAYIQALRASAAATKSASAPRSRAGAGAPTGGLRHSAPRRSRSQSPKAGG
jgi:hypothetical protein